jgi:hypothetical protein
MALAMPETMIYFRTQNTTEISKLDRSEIAENCVNRAYRDPSAMSSVKEMRRGRREQSK